MTYARFALHPSDHVCAIARHRRERDLLLTRFLEHGLVSGWKCLVSMPGEDPDSAVPQIESAVDFARYRDERQLEVVADDPASPRSNTTRIGLWSNLASAAADEGYFVTQVGATPDCRDSGLPSEQLLEYEWEIERLTDAQPVAVLCIYQEQPGNGGQLLELMRTHQRVIFGGVELHNPYLQAGRVMNRSAA
jgi:hypothetical protein